MSFGFDKFFSNRVLTSIIYILFSVTFLLLLPPIFSLIVLIILFLVISKEIIFGNIIIILAVSILLSFLNQQKEVVSDLYNYKLYFDYVDEKGLSNIFSGVFISIKKSEFVFYIYNWLLSFFVTFKQYMFLTSFMMYMFLLYSAFIASRACSERIGCMHKKPEFIFLIIIIFAFVTITFSQTMHLVRQYLAISLFFYGWVLLESNRLKLSLIILLISFFVHHSIILPVIILFLSYYVSTQKSNVISLFFRVAILALVYKMSSFIIIYYYPYFLTMDNGSVPLNWFLLDAILTLSFTLLLYKQREELKTFYYFPILYLILLSSFINIDFIFLRYYFLVDVIRGLLICGILLRFSRTVFYYSLPFLLVISILIFILRFYISEWSYGFNKTLIFQSSLYKLLFDSII